MSFSFIEMWHQMGMVAKIVVYILAAMSLLSLYIAFDRFLVYFWARRSSMRYVALVQPLFELRNFEEALHLAQRYKQAYLAYTLASGIHEYLLGQEELRQQRADFNLTELVGRCLARAADRELARLQRGLNSLATISSAAPFIGLFGTIVGIINAFKQMALSGSGGLAAVSAGIAEALITTAVGIFVAVPALVLFNYLTNRCEEFSFEMQQSNSELLDFFIKEESRQRLHLARPSVFPDGH